MNSNKINWDYIAGLFDGEGCITLVQNTNGALRLDFDIAGYEPLLRQIEAFFFAEGLHPHFAAPIKLNSDGYLPTRRVVLSRWPEVKNVLETLLLRVHQKGELLSIGIETVTLHEQLRAKGESIVGHLDEFQTLREKIHSFSRKGRKTLKPWVR